MTFSDRAIDAAVKTYEQAPDSASSDEAMRSALSAALAVDGLAPQGWRKIDSAPKDGTCVLLLSKEHTDPADVNGGPYHHPAKCAIGHWHAEGSSWCDDYGRFPDDPEVNDDAINLHITGVWSSGSGWFQPNEVTHWQPLPAPPLTAASDGEVG